MEYQKEENIKQKEDGAECKDCGGELYPIREQGERTVHGWRNNEIVGYAKCKCKQKND